MIYRPAPDVSLELYGDNRGTLILDGRPWPVSRVTDVPDTRPRGWIAEVAFENQAIVEVLAIPPDPFWVHLTISPRRPIGDELDLARLRNGHIEPTWLGDWEVHEAPEAWWLNEWLCRVRDAASPTQPEPGPKVPRAGGAGIAQWRRYQPH